jgi:hypothetical protein
MSGSKASHLGGSIDSSILRVETRPMLKKLLAGLLVFCSLTVVCPFESQVSANRPRSVTCAKPDWQNPGAYSTKTGLNTAQTLAIECAKKIWAVTSKTGGKCVCFAEMLMERIGSNQIRRIAPVTDAGPRWAWVKMNPNIDQWSWGAKPAGLLPPNAIWWNNISDSRGHVAIYIGTTRLGKHIYIDNLSRMDTTDGSKVGYWVVGESLFVQRKPPAGVTRNFIGVSGNSSPTSCL